MKSVARLLAVAVLGLLMSATSMQAQSRVRVVRDQTVIWQPGFILVEAIVESGTVLNVVAARGEWYEVVLPASVTRPRATGFVAAARIEPLDGVKAGRPGAAGAMGGGLPARPARAQRGLRGFGHLGLGRFAASQTFASVFGSSAGMWFGGGAEFRWGPWIIEGAAEHFRRTGERVFVLNGQVFPLGIPDTVTLVPILGTAGYRRHVSRQWSVVAGGGLGRYFFRETSTVNAVADTFTTHAASYHVRGDLEWHPRGLAAAAAEIQYTWVPRALSSRLATSFDEHDLGGIQVRFKILFGR